MVYALTDFKEIDSYDELQDINGGLSFVGALLCVLAVVVIVAVVAFVAGAHTNIFLVNRKDL